MAKSLAPQPAKPEFKLERPPSVRVTEKQKKIIEEKFLRGTHTLQEWLFSVARNIALAELFYHPSRDQWGLLDGVRVSKIGAPGAPETLLFHTGLYSAKERDQNFKRLIRNAERIVTQFPDARKLVNHWTDQFYCLMAEWRFLPNSPTLLNAGQDLQQLSACTVIPVEDSIEGITTALQAQALIHKGGGGTGFSFEKLRPKGDPVRSTQGEACGAVNFMKVFDNMTSVVKEGGNRRGANRGVLPVWHPEIKRFIQLKSRPGVLQNFNLSVAVDRVFMEAVAYENEYELLNPRTFQPVGKVKAREIFDLLIENAWNSGDPGIIFTDTINTSSSNPTPHLGTILATNPGGEQPLLPNESCNLGSINLASYVSNGEVDLENLKKAVFLSIRFLDNVIDVNNYPLPEVEKVSKANRRIGLGVMGWAETLVKLGLPYDSDEAITLAKSLMEFINNQALLASEELAKARGEFPSWANSHFDPGGHYFRGKINKPRNCARTTIAPTETIGVVAGVQGTGIEPFYQITPEIFGATARENHFFGLKEELLWEKINKNGKSIQGLKEIPEPIQHLFKTALDIPYEAHIKMQVAFQCHTDNAVAKTIHMPSTATHEDIRRAFLIAYREKCKGITIYRDQSRQQQVLDHESDEEKGKKVVELSNADVVGLATAIADTISNYLKQHGGTEEASNLALWNLLDARRQNATEENNDAS